MNPNLKSRWLPTGEGAEELEAGRGAGAGASPPKKKLLYNSSAGPYVPSRKTRLGSKERKEIDRGSCRARLLEAMREIRVPVVLVIFMMGVTGLALTRLAMDLSSAKYFSLQPDEQADGSEQTLSDWKSRAVLSKQDSMDLGFGGNQAATYNEDGEDDDEEENGLEDEQGDEFQQNDDEDEQTDDDVDVPQDDEDVPALESLGLGAGLGSGGAFSSGQTGSSSSLAGSSSTYSATKKKKVESVAGLALSAARPLLPAAQLKPDVKRSFAYFKGECTYLCKLLKKSGFKRLPGLSIPAHPEILVISYKAVAKYYSVKTSLVNQVGYGSGCIGGGKGKQLACKEEFATQDGCEYRQLSVQPPQWNIRYPETCRAFLAEASKPENAEQIWIAKPGGSFHGVGIKLYKGTAEISRLYPCTKTLSDGMIVQRYLDKPALFAGHKFDFRSYMLIASMNPYIVFYHDGFVRRSEHAYDTSSEGLTDAKKHITNAKSQSLDNHFFNFDQLQEHLTAESGFAPNFMEKTFRPHAKRVTNFLFQAARQKFSHRNGRFQIFALDWMLDANGGMHLLEANGNPQISDYPGVGLTPQIWEDMYEIVHLVQTEPETLPDNFGVEHRYHYNNWHMVYNELEAAQMGETYSPCRFSNYVASGHPLFSFAPKP